MLVLLSPVTSWADCYTLTAGDDFAIGFNTASTSSDPNLYGAPTSYLTLPLSTYVQGSDEDSTEIYGYISAYFSAEYSSWSGYIEEVFSSKYSAVLVPKGYSYLILLSPYVYVYRDYDTYCSYTTLSPSFTGYWANSLGSGDYGSASTMVGTASSNIKVFSFLTTTSYSYSSVRFGFSSSSIVVFDDDASLSDVVSELEELNDSIDGLYVYLDGYTASLDVVISSLSSILSEQEETNDWLSKLYTYLSTSIANWLNVIYGQELVIVETVETQSTLTRDLISDCFDDLSSQLDTIYSAIVDTTGSDSIASSAVSTYTIDSFVQAENGDYNLISYASDWVSTLSSVESSSTITFPGLSLDIVGSTFSIPSVEIDIWSAAPNLQTTCQTICTIVAVLAFLRGEYSLFCRVFGLDFTQDSLATAIDGSADYSTLDAAYRGSASVGRRAARQDSQRRRYGQ